MQRDQEGQEIFGKAFKRLIPDTAFWENTSEDKMLYFIYGEVNADESVEQYVLERISENEPGDKYEDRI